MLADFFTKPLQGKAFKVYRDVLMGYAHLDTLNSLTPSSIKERVEISDENKIIVEETKNEKREEEKATCASYADIASRGLDDTHSNAFLNVKKGQITM